LGETLHHEETVGAILDELHQALFQRSQTLQLLPHSFEMGLGEVVGISRRLKGRDEMSVALADLGCLLRLDRHDTAPVTLVASPGSLPNSSSLPASSNIGLWRRLDFTSLSRRQVER